MVCLLDIKLRLEKGTNRIYENGSLKRTLILGGFIEAGQYLFFLTDHLGSTHLLADKEAMVYQQVNYYPFGMAFADGVAQDVQPYKFTGKELDNKHKIGIYDSHARQQDTQIPRFLSIDPLAEKYYSWSPYVYCANNPINAIDPDGRKIIFELPGTQGRVLEYTYTTQGQLVNSAGEIFDMKSVQGTHLYRIVAAYDKMLNSDDGVLSNKIKTLIDSNNDHYVEWKPTSQSSRVSGGDEFPIKPNKEKIKNGEGVGSRTKYNFKKYSDSDFSTVAHEIQHSYDLDQGNMKDKHEIPSAKSPPEIRAVNNENRARHIEGLKKRTKYGGEEIDSKELE